MSILIKNGYCLGEQEGIYDILIEKNKIKKIGANLEEKADDIIDAKECLVIPTFCNAHTHNAMSLFRGMADDLSLMDWLNNHIFPSEAKYVNKKMVYICSKLSMLEMIRSAAGCFMDMYFFEEEVAKAALEVGMKGVIGEGIIDFKTPDCVNVDEAISKTFSLKEEFESDTIKVSFSPHSTYTLTKESLRKIAEASEGFIVHTHVNETKSEVEMCMEKHKKRPMEVLRDTGLLKRDIYLAHCVVSTDDDIDIMKRYKANVINVPQSNLKLASGIAPIHKIIKKGIDVFIGTDGPASNNNLDILEELRVASLVQKALNYDETAMDAKTTFQIGTNSVFKTSGKLKEGFDADIAIIKLDGFEATPIFNPYSFLAYAANSRDVSTVIINGKIVLKNGEFLSVDEEKIKFDVKAMAKKLGAIF